MKYDSEKSTKEHIWTVQGFINRFQSELERRIHGHDASKLQEPEKSMYDEYKPKIKYAEQVFGYGSKEYEDVLEKMGGALRHHFDVNRHHPEHFENGINDMTLIDVIEMLADWKAASVNSGHPLNLEANRKRFGMSDQLYEIFVNTVKELGW